MEQIKKQENDYEQLYYDELYKNRELNQKCKELEEEIDLLKKYPGNDVKELIIKEIIGYKRKQPLDEIIDGQMSIDDLLKED